MQLSEKSGIIMGSEITRRRECYQHSTPPLTKRKGEFRMGASNSIPAQLPLPIEGATSKQPGKARYFVDSGTKDPLERARTFPAVAAAMAAQWG